MIRRSLSLGGCLGKRVVYRVNEAFHRQGGAGDRVNPGGLVGNDCFDVREFKWCTGAPFELHPRIVIYSIDFKIE